MPGEQPVCDLGDPEPRPTFELLLVNSCRHMIIR
jgi:hypothetical protein